jgi:N-acetylmuramoyl-L-alanine amidase
MTRYNSEVNISNIERANIGNNSNSSVMIRLHADGSSNNAVNGVSVLVPSNKYINNNSIIINSHAYGNYILQGIISKTNAKNNGLVERSDLTGFNWSEIPVILVEMGFLTNQIEDALLNSAYYQNKIILGIIDGLAAYFLSIN